mgnify:CR=1 FL=1
MEAFLQSLGAASPFSVGEAVGAPMAGSSSLSKATIERIAPDGSLDVLFFDGDRASGVDPSSVRKKKKKVAATKGMGAKPKAKKKAKNKR